MKIRLRYNRDEGVLPLPLREGSLTRIALAIRPLPTGESESSLLHKANQLKLIPLWRNLNIAGFEISTPHRFSSV